MKSHTSVKTKPARRLTRAERRAAARETQRTEARAPQHSLNVSPANLAGGIVAVLVVAAAVFYGVLRGMNETKPGVVALADAASLSPAPTLLKVGQKAPNFILQDVYGEMFDLKAQRGHPVLLEFFAVWCPVCQGEAPTMTKLTADFAPRGVRVWSILANPYGQNYEASGRTDLTPASREDLAWYGNTFHVRHAQLVDPKFAVTNRYGVNAYPGIYIVNAQGTITFAAEGHQNYRTLARVLNRALKSAGSAAQG